MYTKQLPFFMRVISPLHVGTGSDIGIIDMPIQREKHTNFPKVESSSLKGALREYFESSFPKDEKIILTFGPESGADHAGAFSVTDATTLFFPVKSAKGVYALITCHEVLTRYNEHCGVIGSSPMDNNKINEFKGLSDDNCVPFNTNTVVIKDNNVVLEEYAFKVDKKDVSTIVEHFIKLLGENSTKRIVMVSDETFRDFVTLSTEVITRNKIDNETGTVKNGALFSEEYLPPETVLFSLLQNGPVNVKDKATIPDELKDAGSVQKFLTDNLPEVFQLGGNATIGKGIVSILKGGAK
jgi:CRISPR-associated protein Cmr4